MPDEKGRLTKEEVDIVSAKFHELERSRGADLVCEVCSHKFWILSDSIIGMRSDSYKFDKPYTRMPSVAFICEKCGNTKFFSAYFMGLKPEQGGGDGS